MSAEEDLAGSLRRRDDADQRVVRRTPLETQRSIHPEVRARVNAEAIHPGAPELRGVAAPVPRGRLRALGRWIRERYMTVDPRTLGLFRLVLGFVVSADLVRHWKEARWFYSNAGVLTNHYHLFKPSSGHNLSLFHAFSSLGEVHVAFALALVCHLLFFIGWHTRLFSVLSFVIVTSLDNRLVMVENGGYVVVNLIMAWAMFMPTGRRFSVDAIIRSYRDRKERTAGDLNERYVAAAAREPFVSGVVMLATVNLAAVYFFNVVNKSGAIWKRGETVHYVLHLDRMVTGLAVFLREHLPGWSMRACTWAVLVTEALIFTWILAPSGRRVVRLLAMLAIFALHASFGVMMRLGPFSWFLIAWSFLLMVPEHWDALEAWYRRRGRPRVVVYDAGSPLAFAIARLLARLDPLRLLRFEPSVSSAGYRDDGTALAEVELIAVRDADNGNVFVGVAAWREIVGALPAGRFAWPLVGVATLGTTGALLAAISSRRAALARFFGLTIPPRGREHRPSDAPLARGLARARTLLRETAIAYLAVCAVSQAINENKSVPAELNFRLFRVPIKHKQPSFMEATILYPRMFQGWGMFAPNPIQDDGTLAVDAITIDGRHVDPFTGKAPDLDLTDARGLGLNQIRQDYFNRIRFDRNKVFRQGLRDYLVNWHKETGRPQDELVAFDVYWVRDQCPRPGEMRPTKNETIPILTYRMPNYTAPPGMPPLPPEPPLQSAGN